METKLVYVPKTPAGYEGPFEVEDSYPVPFPHTDVPVPDSLYSPAFDYNTQQWVETAPVQMIEAINDLKAQTEKLGQSTINLSINDMKMQKDINDLKEAGGEANV